MRSRGSSATASCSRNILFPPFSISELPKQSRVRSRPPRTRPASREERLKSARLKERVSRKDAKIAKTQRRVKCFGRAFASLRSLRLCVKLFLTTSLPKFQLLSQIQITNQALQVIRMHAEKLCGSREVTFSLLHRVQDDLFLRLRHRTMIRIQMSDVNLS